MKTILLNLHVWKSINSTRNSCCIKINIALPLRWYFWVFLTRQERHKHSLKTGVFFARRSRFRCTLSLMLIFFRQFTFSIVNIMAGMAYNISIRRLTVNITCFALEQVRSYSLRLWTQSRCPCKLLVPKRITTLVVDTQPSP